MPSISSQVQNLYQDIKTSKPGQFAQDNPMLTAAAGVGTAVIAGKIISSSDIAATVIKKGVVPAAGAGAAVFGGAMVHDALTNDEHKGGEKVLRAAAGTAVTLAGVETAGRAYGVSPLGKAAKALANVVPKESLIAVAASAPGLTAAAWGLANMKENGVNLGNAAAVGIGGSYGAIALNGAIEKAPEFVQKVGQKGAETVITGSLALGAYAMGKKAAEHIGSENYGKAALFGAGSAALGLGAVQGVSHVLGVPGLEKVAKKIGEVAIKNPVVTASVAVVGVTAGAYALYSAKGDK